MAEPHQAETCGRCQQCGGHLLWPLSKLGSVLRNAKIGSTNTMVTSIARQQVARIVRHALRSRHAAALAAIGAESHAAALLRLQSTQLQQHRAMAWWGLGSGSSSTAVAKPLEEEQSLGPLIDFDRQSKIEGRETQVHTDTHELCRTSRAACRRAIDVIIVGTTLQAGCDNVH